jgi:hypothetical protein
VAASLCVLKSGFLFSASEFGNQWVKCLRFCILWFGGFLFHRNDSIRQLYLPLLKQLSSINADVDVFHIWLQGYFEMIRKCQFVTR